MFKIICENDDEHIRLCIEFMKQGIHFTADTAAMTITLTGTF